MVVFWNTVSRKQVTWSKIGGRYLQGHVQRGSQGRRSKIVFGPCNDMVTTYFETISKEIQDWHPPSWRCEKFVNFNKNVQFWDHNLEICGGGGAVMVPQAPPNSAYGCNQCHCGRFPGLPCTVLCKGEETWFWWSCHDIVGSPRK